MRHPHVRPTFVDQAVTQPCYEEPRLKDYGSLCDLTQRLDLMVPVGLAKAAVGAAVSGVVTHPGGHHTTHTTTTVTTTTTPGGSGGQVLGQTGGGGTNTAPGGTGGVSGGGGAGGNGAGGGGAGGSGGKLPFTGYAAALSAMVGISLLLTGASMRRALRRLRRRDVADSL